MVSLTGSSMFTCDYCEFKRNSVQGDAAVIYAESNSEGYLWIRNSQFSLNVARSNVFTILSTRTTIESTSFIDNFASS